MPSQADFMKTPIRLFLTTKMQSAPEIKTLLEAWKPSEDDSITACSFSEYPTWGTGVVAGNVWSRYSEGDWVLQPLDRIFKHMADLRRVDVKTHGGVKANTWFLWRDFKPGDRTLWIPRKDEIVPKRTILSCCEMTWDNLGEAILRGPIGRLAFGLK